MKKEGGKKEKMKIRLLHGNMRTLRNAWNVYCATILLLMWLFIIAACFVAVFALWNAFGFLSIIAIGVASPFVFYILFGILSLILSLVTEGR